MTGRPRGQVRTRFAMRCDYCATPVRLLGTRRGLRQLLVPRCHGCNAPKFGWPHKLALLLIGLLILLLVASRL